MLRLLLVLLTSFSLTSFDVSSQLEYKDHIIQYDNHKIWVTDMQTNITKEILFDGNNEFEVVFVAILDASHFIAVYATGSFDEVQTPSGDQITLVLYGFEGREKGRLSLNRQPKSYQNHSGYLILSFDEYDVYVNEAMELYDTVQFTTEFQETYEAFYQGDAFVNNFKVEQLNINYPGNYQIEIIDGDYRFSQDIVIHPSVVIIGEEHEGYYLGQVSIEANGELYLNNETYHKNDVIETPGNYQFIVIGENGYVHKIEFAIFPIITYNALEESGQLRENMEFNSPVRIYSNAISMTLDGNPYHYEAIEETGLHQITVYGLNQMRFEISFYVIPSFELERTSQSEVFITVFGEGKLNGKLVTGVVSVTKPGDYTFELLDQGEVIKTAYFTIYELEIDNEKTSVIADAMSYFFVVVIVIGVYFILRKK